MLWAPPTTALLLFEREEKGRDFAEQSPASLSKKGFGSVKGGAMHCKMVFKKFPKDRKRAALPILFLQRMGEFCLDGA
jgi:hypothetical protein